MKAVFRFLRYVGVMRRYRLGDILHPVGTKDPAWPCHIRGVDHAKQTIEVWQSEESLVSTFDMRCVDKLFFVQPNPNHL